ncbi:hypothetical protein [Fuerstiella marisgermanici]|uniref:Uncharacterized protein n=1 Tax=Fuerstiella marisgermanici TaxID=1891926 RepID=A0A1P8WDE5_9PLAN|nr:hypothetical protein [Fuerstiella marisgermanici]APZ92083.1 hypothetical protein Fuma_01687 [Fuerstiella marisgermanici]
MNRFSHLATDFYSNMHLNTEMPLPSTRDAVLEFFGRVQKSYPSMRNFYTRENGDFVMEEDKDQPHHRWLSLEPRRICSGFVNPEDTEDAAEQHKLILELVPYMLTVSPLDCEALDYMMGFDFTYQGNHDLLVAKALGCSPAFERLPNLEGATVLNFEPSLTISLEESCRLQARLMVETRTNAYHVRRDEFPEEHISVFFTVRQYGSLEHDASFADRMVQLRDKCEELLEDFVIDEVLVPLSQAIAAS